MTLPVSLAGFNALPDGESPAPKPLTQATWLKLPEAHPDAAFLRSDAHANMLAVARVVGWAADWETLRSRPTIARIMKVTGLSRRSVQRHTRWLEARGLLRVLEEGATPQFRPGILRHDDANLARTWELADPAMDGTGTPSGSLDFACDLPAPTRPREIEISTGQPPWPLNQTPQRRQDRLKAAESLRGEHLVLRQISAPALVSILRPWLTANSKSSLEFTGSWVPADVLWAIEHLPSGHLHRRGRPVRHPRAWLVWRLAFWAGHPPHSAELAERAERHRTRRVPRRNPGTAPPPEWCEARAAMRVRATVPVNYPPRKA